MQARPSVRCRSLHHVSASNRLSTSDGVEKIGRGGARTRTSLSGHRILSPMRLPVSPLGLSVEVGGLWRVGCVLARRLTAGKFHNTKRGGVVRLRGLERMLCPVRNQSGRDLLAARREPSGVFSLVLVLGTGRLASLP